MADPKYPDVELGRKPSSDDELEATMVEADNGEKESLENQIRRRQRAAKIREDSARKAKHMTKALREE